jgi:Protein kinase domain
LRENLPPASSIEHTTTTAKMAVRRLTTNNNNNNHKNATPHQHHLSVATGGGGDSSDDDDDISTHQHRSLATSAGQQQQQQRKRHRHHRSSSSFLLMTSLQRRLLWKLQRLPLALQLLLSVMLICISGVALLELSSAVMDDLAMGDAKSNTRRTTAAATIMQRPSTIQKQQSQQSNRLNLPAMVVPTTTSKALSSSSLPHEEENSSNHSPVTTSFSKNNTAYVSAMNFNQRLLKDRDWFLQQQRRPHFVVPHSPRQVQVVEKYDLDMAPVHRTAPFRFVTAVTVDTPPPGWVTAATEEEEEQQQHHRRELDSAYLELRIQQPHEIREADPLEKGDCQALAEWQTSNIPTCNLVHEASSGWQQPYVVSVSTTTTASSRRRNTRPVVVVPQLDAAAVAAASEPSNEEENSASTEEEGEDQDSGSSNNNNNIKKSIPGSASREQMRYINEGNFRQVWMFRDADRTEMAMKTLNAESRKDFDKRNQDRHRRDALSFSELTKSPLVVNMYGYCANSGLFDYADGGDLYDIFDKFPDITRQDLLQIAYNITLSIHHAHNFDSQGRATLAHTDIKPDQFLYQGGYYRLSDFNRVRFLTWNYQQDQQCGFRVGKNGGSYRSPEEYSYQLENEKVDVYSLGNVLYFLLAQQDPWERFKVKQVYDLVKQGQRPKVPDHIYNSNGIYERYMIRAMELAWTHDFQQRPGALAIAEVLKEGLDKMAAGQTTIEVSSSSST